MSGLYHESFEKMVFQCSEHFFDHSMSRFAADPKLALRAQTLDLRALRFDQDRGRIPQGGAIMKDIFLAGKCRHGRALPWLTKKS